MDRPIRRVTVAGLILSLVIAPSAWGAECASSQVHPRFLHPTSGQTVKVTPGAAVKFNGDIVRPAGCELVNLSSVIVIFMRKTPAASGQTMQLMGSEEVDLKLGGKWSGQKVLPGGGYLVHAELAKGGEHGGKFGKEERIGITVQEVTLNPGGVKKAPLTKVPTLPTPK